MGLIKMLFHGKELDELEEVLKILLDKMRSIYNPAKEENYSGNKWFYENTYGYGELVNPRTDISFGGGDIIENLKERQSMIHCAERIIILKRNDYNGFNEMSVEFIHKTNRYIQLLQKVETSMPTNIRDIIRIYQEMARHFYYSYKYVVE